MPTNQESLRGLFVTGTDTGVGKTHVGAMIARCLAAAGHRLGVYKPAASGCRVEQGKLVADDAVLLWEAAGRPGELERVCPQRFLAPLAPHLAARAEGKQIDAGLLRSGLDYWRDRAEIVVVEGAGGLMSPLGEEEYVADLAYDLGFPLVIVSRNVLGTINATLQTLITAAVYRQGLAVAGVVLNHPTPPDADDCSLASNRDELARRCGPPLLAEVAFGASIFTTGFEARSASEETGKEQRGQPESALSGPTPSPHLLDPSRTFLAGAWGFNARSASEETGKEQSGQPESTLSRPSTSPHLLDPSRTFLAGASGFNVRAPGSPEYPTTLVDWFELARPSWHGKMVSDP